MQPRLLILRAVAVLLLTAGFVSAAHAQETETSTLTAGIDLFHRGEFEASIGLLKQTTQTLGRSPDRARGHLFLGLAHAVLGSWSDARGAFKRALSDDAAVTPDVDRIPPAIVSVFEEVRRELRGRLAVAAPERSTVFVDVAEVGETPFDGELPIGRHHVLVRSVDGRKQAVHGGVIVEVDRTTTIDVVLKPRSGRLSILTKPTGAEVWIGDRHLGTTPVTDIRLPAGPTTVRLAKEGFEPVTRVVDVPPASRADVDIVLKRPKIRESFGPAPIFGPDLREGVDWWAIDTGCGFGGLASVDVSVPDSAQGNRVITGGFGMGCQFGVSVFDLVEVAGVIGMETIGPEASFFAEIAPSSGPTFFSLGDNASGALNLTLLRFGINTRIIVARIGRVRPFGGIGLFAFPRVGRITHLARESTPGADDAYVLNAHLSATSVAPSAGAKITIFEGSFLDEYVAVDLILEGRLEFMNWSFNQETRFGFLSNAEGRANAARDAWAEVIEKNPTSTAGGLIIWVNGRI